MEANAASVALIDKGKVLLIKRAFAPYAGNWTLPGGRREPGESILACAAREIAEELGLKVTGLCPVLEMAIGETRQYWLAVFASPSFTGTLTPSNEIAGHRWLRPHEVTGLHTTPELGQVLAAAFKVIAQAPHGAQRLDQGGR